MSVRTVVPILIADDDPDDRDLARDALTESQLLNPIHFVNDGIELLDFLRRTGAYANDETPRPGVILVDLNMPRMDGREAIAEIKSDPALRQIPIVVLTTSKAEEDIFRTYDLGVSSYVVKPVTFKALVDVMTDLGKYWFEVVMLPDPSDEA
jgi:CheY-like chemotaxis protein